MNFVVYTPRYDENSGGIIALFKLGSLLSKLGYTCKVWTWDRVHPHEASFCNGKFRTSFAIPEHLQRDTGVNPFNLQPAELDDIQKSVVIYPEIIDGNPLGAKNIVRWLLNKPGKITGTILYSKSEALFYYSEHFLPPDEHPSIDRHLYIRHFPTEIYYQTNFGPRLGSCHLVRKGKQTSPAFHSSDSIQIDGLPHSLVAQIFNVCDEFISYDTQTAYLLFASMCGCKAIAVPEDGVGIEEWKAPSAIGERDGIAYGRDDLARALATRENMLKSLDTVEDENLKNTLRFIETVRKKFHL